VQENLGAPHLASLMRATDALFAVVPACAGTTMKIERR
jgi:hypothetical protein